MSDIRKIIEQMESDIQKEFPPFGYSAFPKHRMEIAQLEALAELNESLQEIVKELKYANL